jgi:hypothetical protein
MLIAHANLDMEVGLQMKRLSGSEDEKEEKQVQFTISGKLDAHIGTFPFLPSLHAYARDLLIT